MAGRRRKPGRKVNGILLLDKPSGLSSNHALQRVKRLYQAQKAGHTGSLDPLATGVLPICLGEATKLSAFLLDADKRYRVTLKLGEKTTTADAEGEVIETREVGDISQDSMQKVLGQFIGEQQQLPPMYSAVKHQGQRLYKLAREGIEVERKARQITIFSLDLVNLALPLVTLDVHCSKGTYVRTLGEDIGEALGCGAHVSQLRRTAVGHFNAEPVTLQQLESWSAEGMAALDEQLLPMDLALQDWPAVELSADMAFYVGQGQAVLVPRAPTEGMLRLYGPGAAFLGIGFIQPDGRVAPKRLIVS